MNEGNPISDKWYWSKRGSDERNGPISGEKLRELAEEGDLEPDDLVWTQGMDDWEEAGSVEKLESLFLTPPSLSQDAGESGSRDAGGQSTRSERSPDVGEGEAGSGTENETGGKRQEHPEYEGKERGIAIVLALLLGGFGGHRFYLGDVLKGSLYLVFSATGIPFLIGLYDAYRYYSNPEYFQKREETVESEKSESVNETSSGRSDGVEAALWRRHPIWTGVIALASVAFIYSLLSTSNDEYFQNNRKKAIKKILSFESEKRALEEAKKYESVIKNGDVKSKKLKSILDSLRLERLKYIEKELSQYSGEENYEERLETIRSAEKIYSNLYEKEPKNIMVRVKSNKEYLKLVSQLGSLEEVRNRSKSICDEETHEEFSSAAMAVSADLRHADAERTTDLTYEVDGSVYLEEDGSEVYGGGVTCRVSWEGGEPEVTYIDTN